MLSGTFFIAHISAAKENSIPDELQKWVPWVLYDQEDKTCTISPTEKGKRYCTWPAKLDLNVQQTGADFSQEWIVESRSLVSLPGNSPFWPVNVQANGKNVLVSKSHGSPAIWLDPGIYKVTGHFSWKKLPENILVPPESGFIRLTLLDKEVITPQIDKQGKLWFRQKKESQNNSEESLGIQVFRKIEDGVPLIQQLHIQLTVSGLPRQITLGLKSGEQFIPLQIKSPLPVRFDGNGRIQLQVRPGQWQIKMTLRNKAPLSPQTLTMGEIDGPWPTEEIWVFATDPKLRQVEISTVPPVDPSRTSLPENWKTFPAYLISENGEMTLTEKNRGNPHPVPNRLQIHRKIWLDEQGNGLTAYDSISGTMTRGWRLNVDDSQVLGKVDVAGNSRLITKLENSRKTGVEVRQGSLALHAESRIQKGVKNGSLEIPALGWDHKFQQLSIELNLPPGWKLLTSSGVDKVSTWLNRWTLLDIFLVLIIGLATSRILGLGWGSIAILLLVFSYHQHGSPRYLWLPLLGLLAIQQVITAETGKRLCRVAGLTVLAGIIISAVPFMVHEIRVGIYPQLEYGNHRKITNEYKINAQLKKGTPPQMADKVQFAESASVSKTRIKSIVKPDHYRMRASQGPSKPKSIQIDPQDMIQTGPGLPDWEWNKIHLRWNGPVNPEQNISFLFITPLANTILAFVRVLLLTLLIGGFLKKFLLSDTNKKNLPKSTVLAIFFCLILSATLQPQSVQAEVPPAEILNELQSRLLAPPKCADQCVTINSCTINSNDDLLEVVLQLDSLVQSAVALPGQHRFFDQILLDRQPATILRQDRYGNPLIRVEPGSHTVLLKKNLSGQNKLSFSFPQLPEHGQALLKNWSINGLRENGSLHKQVSLNRITKTAIKDIERKESNTIEIEPFVRVERTIHLGLKWFVSTRIIRLSPGNVIALDIPLLPGEKVTTDGLNLKDNTIRINMGPQQSLFSFRSSIEPVDQFKLTASTTSFWTEIWFLDVSPIWHVETKGLPEINQTNPAGKRYPEFRPYPGESLQLSINRPVGVPGPTMTINRSKLVINPGIRATESTLSFSFNASRGMQHIITLPPDVDLQKTQINGIEFPLQLNDRKLTIPVKPGKQDVEIGWRSAHGITTKTVTEAIDIGLSNVNTSIQMNVPASRWILLIGGPQIGPAVLFWGELLVIILIAILLGQVKITPLSTLQWLLLSLGLSQVPATVAAVVVAWLLLLGFRKERGHEVARIPIFNLMQVFLVLLTLTALGALFFAIQQGLLGHPDMQIGGNGSNGHTLRWYQDRSESLLPTAWVITVPLLAYRISMLLWALWLAIALLRWLRWGWECFSETTAWKSAPPRPKKKKVLRKRKVMTPNSKTTVQKEVTKKVSPQKAAPEKS